MYKKKKTHKRKWHKKNMSKIWVGFHTMIDHGITMSQMVTYDTITFFSEFFLNKRVWYFVVWNWDKIRIEMIRKAFTQLIYLYVVSDANWILVVHHAKFFESKYLDHISHNMESYKKVVLKF